LHERDFGTRKELGDTFGPLRTQHIFVNQNDRLDAEFCNGVTGATRLALARSETEDRASRFAQRRHDGRHGFGLVEIGAEQSVERYIDISRPEILCSRKCAKLLECIKFRDDEIGAVRPPYLEIGGVPDTRPVDRRDEKLAARLFRPGIVRIKTRTVTRQHFFFFLEHGHDAFKPVLACSKSTW